LINNFLLIKDICNYVKSWNVPRAPDIVVIGIRKALF
jgi:hypothetical protein